MQTLEEQIGEQKVCILTYKQNSETAGGTWEHKACGTGNNAGQTAWTTTDELTKDSGKHRG